MPSVLSDIRIPQSAARGRVAVSDVDGDISWELPNTSEARPRHHSLKGWSFDPISCGAQNAPAAGVAHYNRIYVPESITVANVALHINNAGTGTTALANCFAGLYAADGTRLGVTANQATAWSTSGDKIMALTVDAGQSLSLLGGPDFYVWMAFLVGTQSTTNVQFARGAQGNNHLANGGMNAAPFRYMELGSGLTALPTSFVPGNGVKNRGWWVAIS